MGQMPTWFGIKNCPRSPALLDDPNMSERANNERSLVIVDGSVPSLLALWSEGVLAGPVGNGRFAPVAFVTGILGQAGEQLASPDIVSQRNRLTERCQCGAVVVDDLLDRGRWGLSDQVGLLLRACAAAVEQGCRRVLWAHCVGIGQIDAGPVIEEVARCFERSLLISRVVNIDLPTSKLVRVEMPYIELNFDQLTDLVIDGDVPIDLARWCQFAQEAGGPCERGAHCEICARWTEVRKVIGWAAA